MKSKIATNPVIVKDEIGQCKPVTTNLPPQVHSYGRPNGKDQYNAGAMLSGWNAIRPPSAKKTDVNYFKLNKLAAKKGVKGHELKDNS
jgi:hypothetical protein